MKLLILGGYGAFGSRLCTLLGNLPDLHLMIAGRNLTKAQTFCDGYTGKPTTTAHALDRTDIATHLPRLNPDVLIDASGPFQTYGAGGYGVVQACIDHGVPYLDFADGTEFVTGISAFDDAARAAGIPVLSGLSSCPALTAAAIKELRRHLDTLTDISGGIAPTPRAALGPNVLRAVLGYAGAPIRHLQNGSLKTSAGLTQTKRKTIAPPGQIPLHSTKFALVDVPDLHVFPAQNADIQSIWFGAGTRPQAFLTALTWAAKLRATLKLPNFAPLAPLLHRVQKHTAWGEHRGGMFVEAAGTKDGHPATATWHLLAEGDDGPMVPAMAINATLRKWLAGDPPQPGARAATDLTLDDFKTAFGTRQISMGITTDTPGPLYKRILGPAFDDLAPQVRALHDLSTTTRWQGTARVTRGPNPLANLAARITGFPPATDSTPVTVTLTPQNGAELWQRNFGGQRFQSLQFAGQGRHDRLLMERFGPITVALAVTVANGRLDLTPRHWSFLGVPVPKSPMPQGPCFEVEQDGLFRFDVAIRAPLIGLLVHYQGALSPQSEEMSEN